MNPKDRIKEYLDKKAEIDELFAVTYAKENKSLDECYDFIMSEAQKEGGNAVCMTDEEVFGLAVHYYDEDDIKDIKPINAKVVINRSIELTEEEKEVARGKSAVDDAMLNFYLEADKDTIAETLQEVGDTDSYKEKRDKLISITRAKAKTSK